MTESTTTVVRDALIVTMDPARRIIERGSILIRDDRIAKISTADAEIRAWRAGSTIDARDKVVMPGLVDLHFHTYLTRGVSDDLPLDTWLSKIIYPKIRQITPDEVYVGALMSYCESIKSGTTCVNDMYKHMTRAADAAEEIGIRATLSGLVADESECLETIENNERLVREKHGRAGGRIRAFIGVEWVPIASRELMLRARELADRYGVGIHTHLHESRSELELSQARHGKRPIELAYETGVLGPDCIAAHCVCLTNDEIALLKRTGTHVSHNPVSNAKLGCGVAPVPELLSAGVNVGLGHDGATCNNTRDLFEVMKWAALVHRAHRADASLMSAGQVLEMATLNGARALGLADSIGSVEEGKKADLILLRLDSPHLTPLILGPHSNLLSHLAYSAHGDDVDTVIIDGRLVMKERRLLTIDEPKLVAEVNEKGRKLISRLFQ